MSASAGCSIRFQTGPSETGTPVIPQQKYKTAVISHWHTGSHG